MTEFNIFGSTTPTNLIDDDSSAHTFGLRVRSTSGTKWITHVRYYRGPTMTLLPVALGVYAVDGSNNAIHPPIASGVLADSVEGWNDVELNHPVEAPEGVDFVVAGEHLASTEYYASNFTSWPITSGTIRADRGSFNAVGGLTAPNMTFNDTHYWVDVIFNDVEPTAPSYGPVLQMKSGQAYSDGSGTTDFIIDLPEPSSAENLVVVHISGNMIVATPTGWDSREALVDAMGQYLWDRAGGGQSYTFTMNESAAGMLTWFIAEIEGGAYVDSASQETNAEAGTMATLGLATTGQKLLLAAVGADGNNSDPVRMVDSWSDLFDEVSDQCCAVNIGASGRPFGAVALREVTVDGTYSTTATFDDSYTNRTSIIAAYSYSALPLIHSEDFSAISTGQFLPRSPWECDNNPTEWDVFNDGTYHVLYHNIDGSVSEVWLDTLVEHMRVECTYKITPSTQDSLGGLVGRLVDSDNYVGLEVVLHDGGPGGVGTPEDKLVLYIKNGVTHYEYAVTDFGFVYEGTYALALEIQGDELRGYVDDVLVISHTMNSTEAAVVAGGTGAGMVNFYGNGNFDNFAVYEMEDPVNGIGAAYGGWTISGFVSGTNGEFPYGTTVAEENALTGDTDWQISGWGDSAVQGFSQEFSVLPGATIDFAVDGPCDVIDIYRFGYYNGDGARKVATIDNESTTQSAPNVFIGANSAAAVKADNWVNTASWLVHSNALSGVYVAVVRRSDVAGASHIPFIVRQPSERAADIVVKTSDSTWHAYNYYGGQGASFDVGATLYGTGTGFNINDRAYAVSYERPIIHRQGRPQTAFFNSEYPLLRWLERNGFDVAYIGCYDLDQARGYTGAQVLVSSGHDEYWSQNMRDNAETFRDAGGHLIFMSGNEVFWRIAYADAGRTIWCAKDTMGTADPDNPLLPEYGWTGTWKDTRWPARQPENTITGTDFRMNGINNFNAVIVAATYEDSPFWRHTQVATGTNLTITNVVGFEADNHLPTEDVYVLVGDTTVNIDGSYADDNGEIYNGNGDLVWGIVLQRVASGAVVVGFGATDFAWALDATHDRTATAVNVHAQQAILNLLTDMGAPAETTQLDLTEPTVASWDDYGLTLSSEPAGTMRRWDGTEFKTGGILRRWDGTQFVTGGTVRRWDGTQFIPAP